jgi:hypothetical protein
MSAKFLGALGVAVMLGSASVAHAGNRTVDLSPYVNHGFANGGWFIDGGSFQADLPGATFGNQGSTIPFHVANVADDLNGGNLNFWFGTDDGSRTNLFGGPQGSLTIAVDGTGVTKVYTLADNVFGNYGVNEFSVTFHGAGGDLTQFYVGGDNTKDYNTPNCATTGCAFTPNATDWYNDGSGIVLQQVEWDLPTGFGLTSMTFNQLHEVDGAILAGVTLGVPEPGTWALMLVGFGGLGAVLRRRRAVPFAA